MIFLFTCARYDNGHQCTGNKYNGENVVGTYISNTNSNYKAVLSNSPKVTAAKTYAYSSQASTDEFWCGAENLQQFMVC